ncbi:MAG: DNA mismatch repair endonuclease MutL [archaeon]
MGKIIVLDEALISKIAAGEVVERPASVVKELMENSIDAKARSIIIDIKEGGKSLIKISDDGEGMSPDDANLCFQRHMTSKLKSLSDLFTISTLGFRGEALASISAVSEITIMTKPGKEVAGKKIVVIAGKEMFNEEFGCPSGTMIEVKNLFFNTPARKKYLKSTEIELGHIVDAVQRYALIHPEIHFKLVHDEKTLLDAPAAKDGLSRIAAVNGLEAAKEMIALEHSAANIKIEGFISKPTLTKSSKIDQSIYVNFRYIKRNQTISSAINDAFRTLVMVNRYPVAILNIIMDTEKADVNVHPQKAEIRLQDEATLYQAVFEAVESSLRSQNLIPEVLKHENSAQLSEFADLSQHSRPKIDKRSYRIEPKQELLVKEGSSGDSKLLGEFQVFGIANRTYIIAEIPGHILLIDQHAAAERILFEQYTEELRNEKVRVQKLLEPVLLELSPRQFISADQNRDILAKLGYQTESFGHNTIRVRTIPMVLGRQFDVIVYCDLLDDLLHRKKLQSLEDFFHARIARMACRAAIKAGDEITLPQIKEYVRELCTKDVPYTCPHGRPIMIKWSFYELEKMFKRVV